MLLRLRPQGRSGAWFAAARRCRRRLGGEGGLQRTPGASAVNRSHCDCQEGPQPSVAATPTCRGEQEDELHPAAGGQHPPDGDLQICSSEIWLLDAFGQVRRLAQDGKRPPTRTGHPQHASHVLVTLSTQKARCLRPAALSLCHCFPAAALDSCERPVTNRPPPLPLDVSGDMQRAAQRQQVLLGHLAGVSSRCWCPDTRIARVPPSRHASQPLLQGSRPLFAPLPHRRRPAPQARNPS